MLFDDILNTLFYKNICETLLAKLIKVFLFLKQIQLNTCNRGLDVTLHSEVCSWRGEHRSENKCTWFYAFDFDSRKKQTNI